MKLADLLEEFNVVINTSEGLNELRSLILGLAVRGKLVPQDPNDEPAPELLKMIETEKQRLYEAGEFPKPQKLKEIKLEEFPFEIPNNWKWVRFGRIMDFQGGSQPPKSKFIDKPEEGYVQLIQIRDLGDKPQPVYVPKDSVTKFCSSDDIMIGRYGASVGKVFWGEDGAYNVALIKILFGKINLNSGFLYQFFNSDLFQKSILGISRSAQAGFNKGDILPQPFPLPPLAEQHRIVQKIESLFAEVDKLEAKLNRQTKLDEKLQLAVNAEVQKAPDAEASKSAWTFITSNFDTLYHTSEAIDNLKKNILNEAVRGRLVPQDPSDEPVSELLKKIEAEKQRIYEKGEIRKPKDLQPIEVNEIPFEIPENWEWCRLGQISLTKGGKRVPKGFSLTTEPTDYTYLRVSDMQGGTIIDTNLHFIDEKTHERIQKYKISKDDIYMTIVGATIGKCGLIPERFNGSNLTENAVKITPIIINKEFLYQLLDMPLSQEQFIDKTKQVGVQKMAIFRLKNTLLTLPPLEEQHRIVQRIEDLFAICDRFKAQLEQRQNVNERLVKGLVGEVLEGGY